MSQSIQHYVNVSVALEGTGAQPAGFGIPIFVSDHSVTANRLDGPYTNLADMVTDGFTSTSPEYLWAAAVFAQQPRVTQVYIGRRAGGDANLAASMDAILAVNESAWYCVNLESRTSSDIAALAAWVEAASFPKIAICQSNDASLLSGEGPSYQAVVEGTATDGTYILTFTGFGLGSPVQVSTTRAAGTPATNALIGDALRAALVTAATGPGGSLFGEVDLASIGGTGATITWRMVDGLASGTVVASGTAVAGAGDLTVTIPDEDIGSILFRLQYTRTALIYHATDADYLDGAWSSRCLSADLDQEKLAWSYKRIAGIEADDLTNAQVAALRAINVNYFAPATMSSGNAVQAFTAQGWVSYGTAGAGRRIDTTITLDWLKARLEEALANVTLRETHQVPYTDAGINRYAAACRGVFATGIAAGHLMSFVVPEGEEDEGRVTPFLDFPLLSETTTTQRANRDLSSTRGLVYLGPGIEKVTVGIEARQ